MSHHENADLPADLALAQRAALTGATLGLEYFQHVARLAQERKQTYSIVMHADWAVEEAVGAALMSAQSSGAFIREETGESGSGRRR